jgi:hypothetical protein
VAYLLSGAKLMSLRMALPIGIPTVSHKRNDLARRGWRVASKESNMD